MSEGSPQAFAAGRYAAIDIGTVTCRMLVADVDEAGTLHEVDRQYAITDLGEGVDATGVLKQAAIKRTVDTVGRYLAVRDCLADADHPIAETVAIATSASRDAANAGQFAAQLASRGVSLSVIPGPVVCGRVVRFRRPGAYGRRHRGRLDRGGRRACGEPACLVALVQHRMPPRHREVRAQRPSRA